MRSLQVRVPGRTVCLFCGPSSVQAPVAGRRLGLLEPGDKLPTAQQVVAKLAINPNTVLKAYRDLEREGLVRGRPGQGTFVIGRLPGTDPAAQRRFLAAMTDLLRSARRAGLGPDDIESIYRTAVRNCFTEGVA